MDAHNIEKSIISLANPWLDFLDDKTHQQDVSSICKDLNDELDSICKHSKGRLYGFASLPVKCHENVIIKEIERLKSLPHIKGLILGYFIFFLLSCYDYS